MARAEAAPDRSAAALIDRLALPVGDVSLVERALVHSSWLHEHPDAFPGHNERLEYLGDAVISLVVSEALYARHPDDDEGMLSARRAAIVSTAGLARLAERIELGDALLLGEGEAQRGGRRRPSLLASAFEALVGALHLELGFERTRAWLLEIAAEALAQDAPITVLKSPKSRLQEYTQRHLGERPSYRLLEAIGPDHEKHFRTEVLVAGEVVGVGDGPSRRTSETAAAEAALLVIRERLEGPVGADAGVSTGTGTQGSPA